MSNVTEIVNSLMPVLVPALPYLVSAGTSAAEKLGESVGEGVSGAVKALWARLRPKVEEKGALPAARDLARDSGDADARGALKYQLRSILEADESLAAEVKKLLDEAKAGGHYQAALYGDGAIAQGPGAVAAGKGGIAVGGNVHGSFFNTGDRRGEDR